MSNVYFIGDLHLDHTNILNYEREYRKGNNVRGHNRWLFDCWHNVVNKKDTVYVLGDVAFSERALLWFGTWTGRKILVRGNHDTLKEVLYREVFERIYGIFLYKGHWLTHAPVHTVSLRNRKNVHGHMHHHRIFLNDDHTVLDDRYKSACVEIVQGIPRRLNEL